MADEKIGPHLIGCKCSACAPRPGDLLFLPAYNPATQIDFDRQVWECDVCGAIGNWGPGWAWYGSENDLDGGLPTMKYTGKPIEIICPACPKSRPENVTAPRCPRGSGRVA